MPPSPAQAMVSAGRRRLPPASPTRGGQRRRTVKGVLEAPLDVTELGAEVGHSEQPGEVVSVHRRRGGSPLAVRAGGAMLGARPRGSRVGRPGERGPE